MAESQDLTSPPVSESLPNPLTNTLVGDGKKRNRTFRQKCFHELNGWDMSFQVAFFLAESLGGAKEIQGSTKVLAAPCHNVTI